MSHLAYKSFDLDLKADDADGGFVGYFAAFGNVDRAAEVIESGAFKNLPDFTQDGWIGVNHDMESLPVAMITNATQDDRGLCLSGRFHSHPAAQACRAVVRERMAAGKAVKCSIGYKVLDSVQDFLAGKTVRRLKAINIFEASFVNLPCNTAAEITSAKSLETAMPDKVLTVDSLKAWLAAETKAGRVLSRSNHAQLKGWHKALSDTCVGIKSMIDQYDPDGTGGEPDGDEPAPDKAVTPTSAGDGATSPAQQFAAGKAARIRDLRLRALRSRFILASLPRG